MPVDGGEPTRLTALCHGVAHPVWSPDSTRLAFLSRVGGWQEPGDEAECQKSTPARVITTLKYKYNGEGFTYDRWPHIFVVPADGGAPQQLTDDVALFFVPRDDIFMHAKCDSTGMVGDPP